MILKCSYEVTIPISRPFLVTKKDLGNLHTLFGRHVDFSFLLILNILLQTDPDDQPQWIPFLPQALEDLIGSPDQPGGGA